MNIRQIEVFKAIMECGSITRAAENLNIAQPSVSKHLKLLEYGLDMKLFVRTGNKLLPTAEGQALFDQVERVYTGLGFLEKFATDLRNSQHGEVSLAAMPLMAQKWLPEHLADFMQHHRKVSFSLPVRSSSWIWSAVAARRVHVGIGLTPRDAVAGLKLIPLMKLPVVCLMPDNHPLAHHEVVSAGQMRKTQMVSLRNFDQERLNIEMVMDEVSPHGTRTIETLSSNVACELVRHGVGVGLVDALSAMNASDHGLTFRPFEPKLFMDVCIMVPIHWALPLIAQDLVEFLKDKASQTQKTIAEALCT
ncbi:LysR substrate-binding domain-containing protein [Oceanibium sediminis]|uniref:LysR substrate-binding domain-containing protein n=1 Tax=Oceanibium sediminis TaxID=2026339 RepID=UPI000DD48B70|nr:LysR substrate-binding domain-containing protein [Oceanibium sediminis]